MITVTLESIVNLVVIFCAGICAGKISDKIMSKYDPNMRIWVSSSPTIIGGLIRRVLSLMLNMVVLLMVVAIMIFIAGIILEILL